MMLIAIRGKSRPEGKERGIVEKHFPYRCLRGKGGRRLDHGEKMRKFLFIFRSLYCHRKGGGNPRIGEKQGQLLRERKGKSFFLLSGLGERRERRGSNRSSSSF